MIDIYTHGTDSTGSVLPDWDRNVFGEDREQTKFSVPMTTLDALIGEFGIPDFVKVDVEGFEADVLRGLTKRIFYCRLSFTQPVWTKLSRVSCSPG